jgi:hypothetical protein
MNVSDLEGMYKEVVSAYTEVLLHHFMDLNITTIIDPVNYFMKNMIVKW